VATDILDNAYISLAANVLSTKGNQVEITYESQTVDDTTFADTTRSNKHSLFNWSITIKFVQDFAASNLDSILFPLIGTTIAIEIRTDAGSVGAANPKYTGNGMITSYPILAGDVGSLMETTITIVPSKGSGSATLARATS